MFYAYFIRLVGYIVRQKDLTSDSPEDDVFSCYVFEADVSGKEICNILGEVSKAVYNSLLDLKCEEEKRKKETVTLIMIRLVYFIK